MKNIALLIFSLVFEYHAVFLNTSNNVTVNCAILIACSCCERHAGTWDIVHHVQWLWTCDCSYYIFNIVYLHNVNLTAINYQSGACYGAIYYINILIICTHLFWIITHVGNDFSPFSKFCYDYVLQRHILTHTGWNTFFTPISERNNILKR